MYAPGPIAPRSCRPVRLAESSDQSRATARRDTAQTPSTSSNSLAYELVSAAHPRPRRARIQLTGPISSRAWPPASPHFPAPRSSSIQPHSHLIASQAHRHKHKHTTACPAPERPPASTTSSPRRSPPAGVVALARRRASAAARRQTGLATARRSALLGASQRRSGLTRRGSAVGARSCRRTRRMTTSRTHPT